MIDEFLIIDMNHNNKHVIKWNNEPNRQLWIVINYAALSSRDVVRNFDVLGGNRGRRHVATRVAAIVPLFLSQAFSLVSFPSTNLFLTLSLFLLVGFLKCRTAGKRQTGIRNDMISFKLVRRSYDLYTVWSTG